MNEIEIKQDFIKKYFSNKIVSLKDLTIKDLSSSQSRNLFCVNNTPIDDINTKQFLKQSDYKKIDNFFYFGSWDEQKTFYRLRQTFNDYSFLGIKITNKSFKNSVPKFLKQVNILTNFDGNIKQKQTFSVYIYLGEFSLMNELISKKDNSLIYQILEWASNHKANDNVEMDFNNLFIKTVEKAKTEFPEQIDDLIKKVIQKIKQGGDTYKNIILNTYNNWRLQAGEKSKIEQIEKNIAIASYHETFELARSLNREFFIYVGPTNSGKTYNAMKDLCDAETGAYLAPLRLMALEGQETLFERGVLASLITGEEQKVIPKSTHVSSTVEMVNLGKVIDCAVIDEIQMICDDQRGWAWNTTLIGVPAKKVVLVGSAECLPHILPILELLGEKYTIKHFERKNQLIVKHHPMKSLKELKQGDAIVIFKRKSVLQLKQSLEENNIKASVIYGSLSPEVRRIEADKFKKGESEVLIATDAIGMGLNLPIHRLFFADIVKPTKNGGSRMLTSSEIKQIAGRAGRYGLSEKGVVGTFLTVEEQEKTSNIIFEKLHEGFDDKFNKLNIMPTTQHLKTLSEVLRTNNIYVILDYFQNKLIRDSDYFKVSNLENILEIAYGIQKYNLPLEIAYTYCCAPIDLKNNMHYSNLVQWVKQHKDNKPISSYLMLDGKKPAENNFERELYYSENIIKLCTAYKWLSYKFPLIYSDIKSIEKLYNEHNDNVERILNNINYENLK